MQSFVRDHDLTSSCRILSAAINQWTAMNTAYQESLKPRGRQFNPNDWIPAKVKEQLFRAKAAEFLANKAKLFNRGKLSKSRWRCLA
jgi:hypothetical protein